MHIAFLLTDGFVARMIIRSGVSRRLVANGARVTVITPNAQEAYFQDECQAEGISVQQAPKVSSRIAWRFRGYRAYFLDDIKRNVALTATHGHLFQNRPLAGRAMYAVNRTCARWRWFRGFYRVLEARVNRARGVKKLLQQLRPDLVVLANPFGTMNTIYLLHARELRIPVVCQMASWDNITAKGTPLLMPDYFISWGPVMTKEILDVYHFPKSKILECGVPHFDVYSQNGQLTPREEILHHFRLPLDLPYIFYGMVAETYCPNELQIVNWLTEQVRNDSFAKPCSLVIRPHPLMLSGFYAMSEQKLEQLKALAGPRVALDVPRIVSERLPWDLPSDDMHRLASLLAGSAMCLNASSTLCLDACMAGRPVINIGFDGWRSLPYQGSARQSLDFTHMAKLLAFGGIRVARSFGELQSHINDYLLDPRREENERHISVAQECGPRDGRASERVVDALMTIGRLERGVD